jgi:hypothetical protein
MVTEILRHGKHANAASSANNNVVQDGHRHHKAQQVAPPVQDSAASVQVIPASSLPADGHLDTTAKPSRSHHQQQSTKQTAQEAKDAKQMD